MTASSQNVDPLDALLDFSEYDNVSYQSPTLSPATTNKNAFTARPASAVTSPTIPTTQALNGPSHQYELYKQQTGIVPGALASTLAVQSTGYTPLDLDYLGLSPGEDLFDFNTAPSQGSASLNTSDMDMDFESPSNDPFFFESTVNPSALGGQESPNLSPQTVLPAQTGNVGRLWPGMHSQAALAKAQAQQRQQQQMIQQQRQAPMAGKPRTKSNQPTDPIVEQKITQLLNSMRAKPSSPDQQGSAPLLNVPRPKKDEEEMDEDERLLASEEGKKLSSKERRQLRNKVSARAFRSRRKEYISQLESEIASKVNENGDLRAQNRALMEENKRLSDLTRMLLSSPSFSNFLDHLSSNPSALPQPSPAVKQETPQPQQERRQIPKDINPFSANQQVQQQRIGMAIIPEHNMDFSMLNLENDSTFNFQPQVFALATPAEMPASIDTNILSGKTSNFVGEHFDSDDEKVELPRIERPVEKLEPAAREEPPRNEEFESDPEFALYHSSETDCETPARPETEDPSRIDIFGGIEPEKVLARYELLDADEEERTAVLALARVQRISDRLESVRERIERLTDL